MKNRNFLLQSVFIAFLFSLIIPSGINAEIEGSAGGQLNLRKVSLFKSGVGYFELRGSVEAGEGIELHFKREQMNDLLKSLTILNLSGGEVGHATSVVYDSTKTAKQQLSDYAFDLRKDDGLPQVLEQLQGSKIELIIGNTAITGTIVGVETRITMEDEIKTRNQTIKELRELTHTLQSQLDMQASSTDLTGFSEEEAPETGALIQDQLEYIMHENDPSKYQDESIPPEGDDNES